MREWNKYQDIIHLPRHVSNTHAHMPVEDRAAQFAPFAALTGHHEAVKEAARLTDKRMELDEYCKEVINGKLQEIKERMGIKPKVSVTYFVPDIQKEGGAYVTVTGYVKKVDEYGRTLCLEDGTKILIDEIIEIKG
ncbi:MAG: YolD-like family protein [Dorea sp.]|jgi:hypothetical protein|nr:YolD-like family protein [Dorea sp.]MCI9454015.1 YolD-like family protein [Dorea sp.]